VITHSVELAGLTGHLVDGDAHVGGLTATIAVGLPDSNVRETRDRIRATRVKLGWPGRKVTQGGLVLVRERQRGLQVLPDG
jgi:hypothetical protein